MMGRVAARPLPDVLPVGAQSINNQAESALTGWTRPGATWRPFRDHSQQYPSPFNQAIPASAWVHPNSAAIISHMSTHGLIKNPAVNIGGTVYDYDHPVYFANAGNEPLWTVSAAGGFRAHGQTMRIPTGAKPAGGVAFGGGRTAEDGHLGVVEANGRAVDLWQSANPTGTPGTLLASGGGVNRIDGNGVDSQATAGWCGLLAGIIRYEELVAGFIGHALFVITKDTNSWVRPAGGNASQATVDLANAPANGARLRLKQTISQIDAGNDPAWVKTIKRAMRTYGCIIGDTGGTKAMGIQMESGMVYRSGNGNTNEPWVATYGGVTGVTQYTDPDIGNRNVLTFQLANYITFSTAFEVLDHRGLMT